MRSENAEADGDGGGQGKGVPREEAKALNLCDQEEDSTGKPREGATLVGPSGGLSFGSVELCVCVRHLVQMSIILKVGTRDGVHQGYRTWK